MYRLFVVSSSRCVFPPLFSASFNQLSAFILHVVVVYCISNKQKAREPTSEPLSAMRRTTWDFSISFFASFFLFFGNGFCPGFELSVNCWHASVSLCFQAYVYMCARVCMCACVCGWKVRRASARDSSFFQGSVYGCFNGLPAIDHCLLLFPLRYQFSIGWLLLFVAIMAEYQGCLSLLRGSIIIEYLKYFVNFTFDFF